MADLDSAFTLDDQLCFAAYSASRALTRAYRNGLSDLGLTYTQYVVLLVLWEFPTLSMRSVGERLHLDSATLSPLLRRMERQGLLTRSRSAEDERVVEVSITRSGADLRAAVHRVQQQVELETGLSAGELAHLRSDLHAVADRLRVSSPA